MTANSEHPKFKTPSYLLRQSALAGAALCLIAVAVWYLDNDQQRRLQELVNAEAHVTSATLELYVKDFESALQRMANRSETDEDIWKLDAKAYLENYDPLKILYALGNDETMRLIEFSPDIQMSDNFYNQIQSAPFISPWQFDGQWYVKRVYSPSDLPVAAATNLRALISIDSIVQTLEQLMVSGDYQLGLSIDNTVVLQSMASDTTSFSEIDLLGSDWTLSVAPTAARQIRFARYSSEIALILLVGILVALLGLQHLYLVAVSQSRISSRLHDRLSESLDAMLDSVVVINNQGIIRAVNSSTLDIFGYERHELLGENVKCLMPNPYRDEHDSYISSFLDTNKKNVIGQKRTLKAVKKNGDEFPITLWVTQHKEGNGESNFTGVIHDLSAVVSIEESMQEKEALLNTSIQTSKAGWAIVDLHARFSDVNNSLAEWLGYTQNELIGLPITTIYPEHELPATERFLKAFMTGEYDSRSGERMYLTKDGKTKWGMLSASLIRDKIGNPVAIVSQIIDIDRQKTLEQELKIHNAALAKSNEELDQFAYIASHDLKSPLNAIGKLANWIEEDCAEILPDDSKSHFELLQNRILRLTTLLDDLLQYSRVGRVTYANEQFNLRNLVNEIFEMLSDNTAHICVAGNLDIELPVVPVELVLRNLIGNALKHRDNDSCKIIVNGKTTQSGYEISVEDDGPGIPENLRVKAVQMFQTLQSRDEKEGSGMGLALCEKTLAYYGGNLTIKSRLPRGTVIVLDWPKLIETPAGNLSYEQPERSHPLPH